MIPVIPEFDTTIEEVELPTETHKINTDLNRVLGWTDGVEAVRQAIYLMLQTERYEHIVYSWQYGVELNDLFGKPIPFVLPELKRRITDTLLTDDRILRVDDFSFDVTRRKVLCTFTVTTIYGEVDIEQVVSV